MTKARSARKQAAREAAAATRHKPDTQPVAVQEAVEAEGGGFAHALKSGEVFATIARAATQRAWTVIMLFILMAGLGAGLAATKLDVDTDPALMIDNDLDFRQQYKQFSKTFPSVENNFLFIIDSDEPEESRKAAERLEKALLDKPDLFRHVVAPGVGKFFDDFGILYAKPEDVKELTDKITESAPAFTALADNPNMAGLSGVLNEMTAYTQAGRAPKGAEVFLDEIAKTVDAATDGRSQPLEWTELGATGDGPEIEEKRWFVMSQPILNFAEVEAAAVPMKEARSLLEDPAITNNGKVTIQLTGEAALNAEEFEAVSKGALLAGIISFTLVTITVFFGLPSMVLIVPALSLIVLGFLINAGFATLSVGYLNLISVAFAVLFIGLGIDYAVHVVLRFAEHRARGETGNEAAVSAVQKTGPALALCTLTTALAFLAFTPTDFVGMAQLGIIAAGGLVIAFVASLTLVPAILSLMPGKQEKFARNMRKFSSVNGKQQNGSSFLRAGATVIILGLAAGSLFLFPQAKFDGDPINLKDPAAPTVQAFLEILDDQPGEVYSGQVLAAPGQEARTLAENLKALPTVKKVHSIEDFLPPDQEGKVADLNSLADIMPRVVKSGTDIGDVVRSRMLGSLTANMKAMSETDDAPATLKASAVRLHKSLMAFEDKYNGDETRVSQLERNLFEKLPDMLADINQLATTSAVSVSTLQESLRERFIADDGRWRLEVIPAKDMRNTANLREFVKDMKSVEAGASGSPVDIAGSASAVARSMVLATLAALVMVVFLSWPVLRRIRYVLLVLAPLLLAACLMVGYTVVFDAPFNFANVIVLPLLIGLGVDSAVHYVMRAREEKVSTDVTGTSTPRAVMISAFTTIGSFGTLWLSGHRGMASMGELLTIAILVTLICTLIVLPQLMHWVFSKRVKEASG